MIQTELDFWEEDIILEEALEKKRNDTKRNNQ